MLPHKQCESPVAKSFSMNICNKYKWLSSTKSMTNAVTYQYPQPNPYDEELHIRLNSCMVVYLNLTNAELLNLNAARINIRSTTAAAAALEQNPIRAVKPQDYEKSMYSNLWPMKSITSGSYHFVCK